MTPVVGEAWKAIIRRPNRSILTSLGVILGVGALVAIVGIAASASVRISSQFDAYAATAVRLAPPPDVSLDVEGAEQRLESLPGVRAAGQFAELPAGVDLSLTSRAVGTPQRVVGAVASASGLSAAEPVVRAGRLPSAWQLAHDPGIVVLGEILAKQLEVDPSPGRDVLYINGQPHVVAALISDRGTRSQLALSVILAPPAARALGLDVPNGWLVRVERGAGQSVAAAAPLALYPQGPDQVLAQVPPDPTALRGRLSEDAQGLFTVLSLVTLLVGTAGIANTMLVSVLERQPEIGLRRALGATRRQISALFLAESVFIGTVGGCVGTVGGILVAAVAVAVRGWDFAMPLAIIAAPLVGLLVGTIAGAYPAYRSTKISPAEVLRGGV